MKNKIWRRLILVIAATVLGVSVYNWNSKTIIGNPLPMPFGVGVLVVLSGSMEPTLSTGDLVIIKETDTVNEQDIIVFQDGNAMTIHRIVGIDGSMITTQGDSNNVADAPITMEAVKGKLLFRIPFAGRIVTVLSQPIAIIILLASAVLLTELSYRKEKEKDEDELERMRQEIKELVKEIKEKQ